MMTAGRRERGRAGGTAVARVTVCAALGLLLPAARLPAQQLPRALSPRFAAVADRTDTTVTAWVIGRPGADLDRLAAAVGARGGRVRRISRFARAVSAELPSAVLRDLARRADVARVQPVATFVRRRPELQGTTLPPPRPPAPPRAALAPDTLYGPGAWAIRQLHVDALHARGLRGAGVRVAVLDAGFNTAHPFLAGATVIAQRDFVYGDSIVADEPDEVQGEMAHGTAVWSLLAARAPGTLYGVAPDAEYLLAKTEFGPTETRVEEDNWVAAVEWAVALEAHIISSSLGYRTFDGGFSYSTAALSGDIAVTTVAADSAAARGVLVVVSVGNEGPLAQTLGSPADGDSVLAVGATDSLGRVAGFSSRGPSGDGRLKPDVVAPGVLVPAAGIGSGLIVASGTSFSAPLVAGLAALVQGARPGRPALDLLAGLRAAGDSARTPNAIRGWGIPDARAVYAFPTGIRALTPAAGTLTTVTPTFAWDAGTPPPDAGPNTYRLRLATDSLLLQGLLDTVVATTSFSLPAPLHAGTRVWWSVTASSTLGVVESTAVQGPLVAPAWATLLTLASPAGASIRDTLPTLAWRSPAVDAPPGPFRYDVDVYPSSRLPAEAVASARDLADTVFRPTTPLERNLPFRWRVVARLAADSEIVTSPGTFVVLDESVPTATLLYQNFPNPFPNAAAGLTTTCFWFDLAQEGPVRLEIFDVRGRRVRRLVPAPGVPERLPPGRYGRPAGDAPGTCDPILAWDGRDEGGGSVRPGVYIVRLTAPGHSDTRRVVFRGQP
jgi:hypothetical protein